MINKDEIKRNLSIEEVFDYVMQLGGDPHMGVGSFTALTICHGGDSHKLYYYDNTQLFHCYTGCDEPSFDIYELTRKVKSRETNRDWSLPKAINYVANYFGYELNFEQEDVLLKLDFEYFKKKDKLKDIPIEKKAELKIYNTKILENLPQVRIESWEKEGITFQTIKNKNIRYNPANQSIIIPHYNIGGDLVGIRERTLITENEVYGKYRPATFNKKMYNHPLSFNLYNLNYSKENIKQMGVAIVFESEKSCLQYASMFGEENDVTVACCGSNLISHQVELLLFLGVKEIIIGFDKQFKEIGDEEFKKWTRKLTNIHKKYHNYVNISFLFDKKNNLLGYKDSPTDRGRDAFIELYMNRITL